MQEARNKRDRLEVGLLALPVVAAGFIVARFAAPILDLMPPCPFRTLTQLPCPSCGATRAGLAMANGDFVTAMYYNPLFVIGLGVLLMWSTMPTLEKLLGRFFFPVFWKATPVGDLETRCARVAPFLHQKQFIRWLAIGAIVLNWLYLIVIMS